MKGTIDKASITRMRNKLRREISKGGWQLDGPEFAKYTALCFKKPYVFPCWFYCNLKQVRAYVGNDFGLAPSEKTFEGAENWWECIDWVLEQLARLTELAQEVDRAVQNAKSNCIQALQQREGE